MKQRQLAWALCALILVILCLWRFFGGMGAVTPVVPTESGSTTGSGHSKETISERMLERDFNTLKVELPAPEDKPWKGPLWNSSDFKSPENAKAALEVLPIWIRKSVLDGHTEQVGAYLFSLSSYLDEKDDGTRFEAALLLYKLGSRDEKMLSVLKYFIENGTDNYDQSKFHEGGPILTRRATILEHLLFYSDHTLDDFIESVFQKLQAKIENEQSTHELAMYLEAAGRPRTDAFWLERLNSSSGMVDAFNVLRERKTVDLVAILKPKIDANSKSVSSLEATALVYGISGEPAYEPLLTKVVDEAVKSGSPVTGLEIALQGLLKGKSPQAAIVTKKLLNSENMVLHDVALAALSCVREPGSIHIIKNYAMPLIEKDMFPATAFKALIDMGGQQSDEAYETLKRAVLSRAGRSEADFASLEFAKKHRTQIRR